MGPISATRHDERVSVPATVLLPRRLALPITILAWFGVIISVLWGMSHVVHTVLILVIASLIAFALFPAVNTLARIMPRGIALFIVYIVFVGVLGFLGYFVVNTAIVQSGQLVKYLQLQLTAGPNGQTAPLIQTLQGWGLPTSQITNIGQQLVGQLENLSQGVLPAVILFLSTAFDVIIVLILSIYLQLSGIRMRQWFEKNVPIVQRDRTLFVIDTVQQVAGGYIRGQVTLALITGTLVTITLLAFNVPYAILLGLLAFVLDFIPVLGSLISGIISIIVALSVGWLVAVGVLVAFVGIHLLDGYVLGPRIVGGALGLNPLVIFVALLIGAELFGIWGALLAAPSAGVVQAFAITLWQDWRRVHPDQFPAPKDLLSAATTTETVSVETPA